MSNNFIFSQAGNKSKENHSSPIFKYDLTYFLTVSATLLIAVIAIHNCSITFFLEIIYERHAL
jgi:hypothetical protein